MYLLGLIVLSSTLHFSMNYFYKEKYEYFLASLFFCIIYNYGKVEIYFKNEYNRFINISFVECINDKIYDYYNAINAYDTEIILNNNVVEKTTLKKIINNYNKFLNNDIVIYTEKCKNAINKKVILNDVPVLNLNPESCDYKFLSVVLYDETYPNTINNTNIYDIKLINKNESFFVVNNRINSVLICYLLKEQYNVCISPYFIKYKIQIIDNSVKFINVSEKEEIVLSKSNYEIVPYNYTEVKRGRYIKLISYNFDEGHNDEGHNDEGHNDEGHNDDDDIKTESDYICNEEIELEYSDSDESDESNTEELELEYNDNEESEDRNSDIKFTLLDNEQ